MLEYVRREDAFFSDPAVPGLKWGESMKTIKSISAKTRFCAVVGNPVAFVRTAETGVPSAGVTKVGPVASTAFPEPVVPPVRQTQTPNPRLTMTAEKRLFFLGAEGREEDGGSIKKEASL